jgi:putative ABC transport system permease protein
LGYGCRGIRKQPGFSLLAITALALGIGAATTIFSVIDNVLLDSLPYADPQRLVVVSMRDRAHTEQGRRDFFPVLEFLEYQKQNHVFDQMFGTDDVDVLYTGGEGTERFSGAIVTPNAFGVLGVPPLIGRTINPDDGRSGAPPVFVISYKMWIKRYNRDCGILGRTLVLNGKARTLVGIMPPRFSKRGADLWMPVTPDPADTELRNREFLVHARMRSGVTLEQAEADLNVIAHRLARLYPQQYPTEFAMHVETLTDSTVAHFRKTLYTVSAAVGFLLLIACSNVANMLLSRASAREKEMAVRASLGASRLRLIRQLLLESLVLALSGTVAGCLVAYAGIKVLADVIPYGLIPEEVLIRIDLRVLIFSLVVAGLTTILFGLGPALQAVRPNIAEPLKDSGKRVSGGFRRGRLIDSLVVLEVGMSLVLLVGAGLLMRSFVALQQAELGLNPDNILVARLPLPRAQYSTGAAKQHFFRPLLQRLYTLPGVVAATETSNLPPYGGIPTELDIPGMTHAEKWYAIFQLCSEGYFPTLGIRLLRGRALSEREVNDARRVAVVNQTLARKYFGQEDPVGRQIKLNALATDLEPPADPVFEVIGVVADVKNQGIQKPPTAEAFIPYTITGSFERGILVRTSHEPMVMLNAVRREIWGVDRNVALTLTGSLKDFLKQYSYAEARFSLVLLGIFAGVGMALVAIGVYSVMAYAVSRQTHEIGIRMALGASQSDLLRMVLGTGGCLIGVGVIAGLAASSAATRLLGSQIWGVSPHDPMTLVGVIIVVSLAGLAACYFPARKATRVDPLTALRHE